MAYSPPAGNALNFDFTDSYSVPSGDALEFDFFEGFQAPEETFVLASFSPLCLPVLIPVEIIGLVGLPIAIPSAIEAPSELQGLIDLLPSYAGVLALPLDTIVLLAQSPTVPYFIAVPAANQRLYNYNPHPTWTIARAVQSQTVYIFRLSATGLETVTIPVSSVQMRRRDGEPTYMAVTVPSSAYSEQIAARADGEMIVYQGARFADGSMQLQEIARADLEDIRPDQGAHSYTVSLAGHRTVSNTDPKIVELVGTSYINTTDGKRRYRCAVNPWIAPGDTAVAAGASFTVGYISYTISTRGGQMEVVEA